MIKIFYHREQTNIINTCSMNYAQTNLINTCMNYYENRTIHCVLYVCNFKEPLLGMNTEDMWFKFK
jgi:hypothetical protein